MDGSRHLLEAYRESYRVQQQKGITRSIGKEIAGCFIYPSALIQCLVAALEAQGLQEMGKEMQDLWDEKYEARYWFEKDGKYLKDLKG